MPKYMDLTFSYSTIRPIENIYHGNVNIQKKKKIFISARQGGMQMKSTAVATRQTDMVDFVASVVVASYGFWLSSS